MAWNTPEELAPDIEDNIKIQERLMMKAIENSIGFNFFKALTRKIIYYSFAL